MKITKTQLKQIIKEALAAVLEATDPGDQPRGGESGRRTRRRYYVYRLRRGDGRN